MCILSFSHSVPVLSLLAVQNIYCAVPISQFHCSREYTLNMLQAMRPASLLLLIGLAVVSINAVRKVVEDSGEGEVLDVSFLSIFVVFQYIFW